MRVLVTGHNGYIGSVLVSVFADAGHQVVGLDNYLFERCSIGDEGSVAAETIRVDLRDVEPEHLQGIDAIVHLAALSNDPLGSLAPDVTYDINHRASVRLARLARDAGVGRFLYSSSCSIYGASGGDAAVDEIAPMQPITPYARSKVLVEDDLHGLADADFSPVYLRNATAFGFSPRLRTDLVLNDLVAWAHLTGEVLVMSDGTPWRPIVHIEDISRAFLAALEAPREAVHDEAFNVGSATENYQVRDLADIVAETVPDSRIVITGQSGGDPRSYRVDFSKISGRLPAFVPAWSARRGAQELLDAYQRYGLTEEDSKARYKRLAWLKRLQADGEVTETLRWRVPEPAKAV
jgi:nucleoside-diphosphate-sugar epimerase